MKRLRPLFLGACWLASLVAAYSLRLPPLKAGDPVTEAGQTRPLAGESRVVRRNAGELLVPAGGPERNVPQLLARVREQFTETRAAAGLSGLAPVLAPLLDLSPAQLAQALAELEDPAWPPKCRFVLYQLLLSQWAERDGPAALDYLQNRAVLPLKSFAWDRTEVEQAIRQAWAAADPEGAWQWHQTHQTREGTIDAELLATMAANDFEDALRRLETVKTSGRRYALELLCAAAEGEGSRLRVAERAALLPLEDRRTVFERLVQVWMQDDPAGAQGWISSLPAEDQPPLWVEASWMLMESQPEQGAQLLLSKTTEWGKSEALLRVVSAWSEEKIPRLEKWLEAQPPGQELDQARHAFALRMTHRDPLKAINWAQAIQHEGLRVQALGVIKFLWQKKDPVGARALVEKAGSSEGALPPGSPPAEGPRETP